MDNSALNPILVVDDEISILNLMKLWFETRGYSVVTVPSGQAALEAVRKRNFFVVLLDLTLKDMNGFDVLTQVKKIQPALPIIMVTGHHEETDARKSIELGALEYITKPVDFNYLTRVLDMQKAA